MAITPAMNETLELPLEVKPAEACWFGGGGCVVKSAGLNHVYVRGTLVGSFGPKDSATRNLLMVGLAQAPSVHLEHLAAAFGCSPDGLRRIRRLYEAEGGRVVMQRGYAGRISKVKPSTRRRLHKAFEGGATVTEAWQTVGKKAGHGRSLVGDIRQEWAQQRDATATAPAPPAPPHLTLVPQPPEAMATSPREQNEVAAQSVAAVSELELGEERVKSVAVENATAVQHLGSWLLVAMVARLGLHEQAHEVAEKRVSATALRVALDAVVVALAIGQRCVEGVRRLATSTAASLLMATGAPSPSWTRRTLGRFAADDGGISLHLKLGGAYLREAQATATAKGPVFYVDNHLRPYTGKEVIRRGWRMQDKRVRPGTSDYYVHDEDGRPVLRLAAPNHGSLTEWLSPLCVLLRMALPDETILVAFDRAGAFPEQLATLRDAGFEFVTYERKPYPLLPEAAFTEKVILEGETLLLCDTRKNLGKSRGRVRRIAVRLPDGHQLNLLANSKRTAVELVEVMSGRWRQENGFKHGVERWGINQLDGRTVVKYPPDTIIPNPARRRLDRAIRIARVREGDARAELARLTPDADKRAAVQREVDEAVAEQARLEALRPSTPPKAKLEDTELADTLVQHTVEYKLTLDTIRIACANAESDLASMLAPKLPRATEAKKTLANLFAAPGDVRVGRKSISVCLSPAGTRREQRAFQELLAAVNRLKLSMPGDQQHRPLRFATART
jgi:hypothetical protein